MSNDGWIQLGDLRPGAIFETRDGVRAVKSEYRYPNGGCVCVLLASGSAGHFAQSTVWHQGREHNATMVREVSLADATAYSRGYDKGRESGQHDATMAERRRIVRAIETIRDECYQPTDPASYDSARQARVALARVLDELRKGSST